MLLPLISSIPEAAWPYVSGIIGAAFGGLVAVLTAAQRNQNSTLLLNQKIIKEQLAYASDRSTEAIRQQEAIRGWLSIQLSSCKEELEKLSQNYQSLEEELIKIKIENARLIERLETKDFG